MNANHDANRREPEGAAAAWVEKWTVFTQQNCARCRDGYGTDCAHQDAFRREFRSGSKADMTCPHRVPYDS